MTKEQFEKGKELDLAKLFAKTMLEGLELAKGGGEARLRLLVYGGGEYNLDAAALEAVLDTLISMYEERLKQIEKEFNEL